MFCFIWSLSLILEWPSYQIWIPFFFQSWKYEWVFLKCPGSFVHYRYIYSEIRKSIGQSSTESDSDYRARGCYRYSRSVVCVCLSIRDGENKEFPWPSDIVCYITGSRLGQLVGKLCTAGKYMCSISKCKCTIVRTRVPHTSIFICTEYFVTTGVGVCNRCEMSKN